MSKADCECHVLKRCSLHHYLHADEGCDCTCAEPSDVLSAEDKADTRAWAPPSREPVRLTITWARGPTGAYLHPWDETIEVLDHESTAGGLMIRTTERPGELRLIPWRRILEVRRELRSTEKEKA